ncbi:MAG: DUF3987 domain-containing protein, partial [SAR202 cluster bacterium]|nr:DUF3987 domain-containing protein [SAR202 cluster bacterium]
MYDLAAIKNLNIKKENYPTSKKDLPQSIWDKSEVPNHSDSKSFQLAKSYFTKHRKIPIESYSDLLRKGLIRINKYKDVLTLVYPSLTPETAALAMESKPYGIKRIQRIFLNPDGSKHRMGKKHLGSNENDSAAFVIPPLNKKDGQNYAVVFEGLEDALSIRSEYPGSWFLVATDKAGLKHVQGFFKSGKLKECLVIADHDTDFKPEVTGQALAWQLGQTLEDMGIKVTVKMPPKPKEDANSALQSEGLGTWLKSLIDIPEEYRNGNEWPIPKQLPDAPPPPPQLDPEILPQPLADFAKAAALENEVSPEAVAAFLLSSIGAVTGSRFCIKPDSRKKNWYEFPIRSTALVMDVSQNKSGVFRAAIGPLERLQRSYKEENEKAASDYFYEQEIHERLRKGLLSRLEKLQKDGEPTSQVEQELRNMILPNVPDKKTISITAGTRQKIIEILSKGNERGLLIKRDELAGWFAGLDRLGNEGDREFYLEGMTVALNYDNHTIGRGEDFTPVLALSICG